MPLISSIPIVISVYYVRDLFLLIVKDLAAFFFSLFLTCYNYLDFASWAELFMLVDDISLMVSDMIFFELFARFPGH